MQRIVQNARENNYHLKTLPIDDSVDAIGIGYAGLCRVNFEFRESSYRPLAISNRLIANWVNSLFVLVIKSHQ